MQCVGVRLRAIIGELNLGNSNVKFKVSSESPTIAKVSLTDGKNTVVLKGFNSNNIEFLTATTLGNYVKYWSSMPRKHKYMDATSLIVRGYINKYFNKNYIPREMNGKYVAEVKSAMIKVCSGVGAWKDMSEEIRLFVNLICDKAIFVKTNGEYFSLNRWMGKKRQNARPVVLLRIKLNDIDSVTADTLVDVCENTVRKSEHKVYASYVMALRYLKDYNTLGHTIIKQRQEAEEQADKEKMETPADLSSLQSLESSFK